MIKGVAMIPESFNEELFLPPPNKKEKQEKKPIEKKVEEQRPQLDSATPTPPTPQRTKLSAREIRAKKDEIWMKKISKELSQSMEKSNLNYKLEPFVKGSPVAKMRGTEYIPVTYIKQVASVDPSITLPRIVYNKNELMDELRNLKNRKLLLPDTESVIEEIDRHLSNIKHQTSTFIDPEISPVLLDLLKANNSTIKEYASITEFEVANHSHLNLDSMVKQLAKMDNEHPHFVFKTGHEVEREKLANNLLTDLQLSDPLAPKWNLRLQDVEFEQVVNPEGVISEFVKDSTSFDDEVWKDYTQMKRDLSRDDFFHSHVAGSVMSKIENESFSEESSRSPSPETTEDLLDTDSLSSISSNSSEEEEPVSLTAIRREREFEQPTKIGMGLMNSSETPLSASLMTEAERTMKTQKLKEAEAKLLSEASIVDIQTHVISDLCLDAYDSHSKQYLLQDGRLINIDFARFLSPHETMKDADKIIPTFRSCLLDHPASSRPIDAQLLATIKQWDVGEIEAKWRSEGLIGDEQLFQEAQEKLELLNKMKNIGPKIPLELLRRYHNLLELEKPIEDYHDKEELRNDILKEVDKRYSELKKVCYAQIHPQAFEEFKTRLHSLQAYVQECEQGNKLPTLAEAFDKMYPDLSIFHQVLGRYETNPGDSLAIMRNFVGDLNPRTLDSILDSAETYHLATTEEMEKMKSSLALMRERSPPLDEILTTCDMIDN